MDVTTLFFEVSTTWSSMWSLRLKPEKNPSTVAQVDLFHQLNLLQLNLTPSKIIAIIGGWSGKDY